MKRFFSVLLAMCVYTSLSAQTYDSIEKEFGSLIDNLAKDFSQHDYILSDANLIYELANRNTLLAQFSIRIHRPYRTNTDSV